MPGILVVAEQHNGQLCDVTAELIGAAVTVKSRIGGPLRVLVIGASVNPLSKGVALAGVDEIQTVQTASDHFDPLVYEQAVMAAASQDKPFLILIAHTANGTAFAAGVAARLGAGLASDVFGLDVEGELIATRSAYRNKVAMELDFPGKDVVVLTLRGATFAPAEQGGSAPVSPISLLLGAIKGASSHIEYQEPTSSGIDITKAEFILSVGRGIQNKDNVQRFEALAERIGAVLGCSRPIVDSGWLPKAHQVGQSGKLASNCQLYLAVGISGATQHLFGMKHVPVIIAVNTDLGAPIFDVATFGTTVDMFELADALERHFN
ncbi:electron transfer flavoprotein subunit alpha/FixB family protein [Mesorhizobium waimense]|uniref:Electron transfer flavoprotein subunit alpha/FixB family protein n=1 Tax=Mesorhizobium waimense TaxID=1300307 RepID=A0A3A5K023_9HYPH|nr:electron transfer flavoprotein subunit alpha/FixB family protein [Mesorhizobium waimense]RJT26004.1 electron transfer flavoprotein subunit alpha/FixB family protein [Mesorhizobium waimense]